MRQLCIGAIAQIEPHHIGTKSRFQKGATESTQKAQNWA